MTMELLPINDLVSHVGIDCVIFGYEKNQLKVLIPKLNFTGDFYALPSGFIGIDEDIDDAARRILKERTGLNQVYLDQFRVFGRANRNTKAFMEKLNELNPGLTVEAENNPDQHQWFTQRQISIGYYALVDLKQVKPSLSNYDQSIEWYNIHEIPNMIIDHNEIANEALKSLRSDINEKLNAFNLLPEKFTISEVQEIYETINEKTYTRTNFQKMILDLNVLERLEKKFTGAKNRAPFLYRIGQSGSAMTRQTDKALSGV
jgi:8-oxo-dGTP diphosphatase